MNQVIEKSSDTIVIDTGTGTQSVESVEIFEIW